MGYDVKADIAAILAYTEREDADPAARFALISTLSRYQEQLRQLQDVKAALDAHGTMISMRDSYGRTVLMENPAVGTYAKVTKQANATAAKLLALWSKVK